MQRGFPYQRGLAVRPQAQTPVMAGSDCWIEMQFLDRTGAAATPTALTYRLDDITNGVVMVATTSLSPSGSTYELRIPGATNSMSNTFVSSQTVQVVVTATFSDSSVQQDLVCYELIAIANIS